MARHGKRYSDSVRGFDSTALHEPAEALGVVKSVAKANFDETVEVAFRLGIDPRKADQAVRGTVSLPHGTGKAVRVAVFAQGDAARAAKEAGADFVGDADLVTQVEGGMLDFDVAVATPDMMGQVGKLGKILGPRGLMPNPKSGTVTPDAGEAVNQFKAGRVEYRNDRFGNVHFAIGRASFDVGRLLDNYRAAVEEVVRAKPASSKGRYIRGVAVSSTMGPGVKIDPAKAKPEDETVA